MIKQFGTVVEKLILPKHPEIVNYNLEEIGDWEKLYTITYTLNGRISIPAEVKLVRETKTFFYMCAPEKDEVINVFFNFIP